MKPKKKTRTFKYVFDEQGNKVGKEEVSDSKFWVGLLAGVLLGNAIAFLIYIILVKF